LDREIETVGGQAAADERRLAKVKDGRSSEWFAAACPPTVSLCLDSKNGGGKLDGGFQKQMAVNGG
jgi:hypothetical protein